MPFIYNVPFISIMLTLMAAMVTPFFRKTGVPRYLCLLVTAAVMVLNVGLLIMLINNRDVFVYMMGHFPAPFGNELKSGPFEALMGAVFPSVMFLCIWGGRVWIDRDISKERRYLYYLMLNLLLCSMLALIYTNDIFTGYVFIEINTIAACSIVMIRENEETITATIRYLIMSLLGSGLVLLGICILYSCTGHLLMESIRVTIDSLMETGGYRLPLTIALGLTAISMGVKSALYPFHSWLPDAHSASTTVSSAILSGLVIKCYIIFLIKIMIRVFGKEAVDILGVSDVLFILGIGGMIIGSINAMRESHVKRLIAYSSVAQIGYIFMGLGLGNEYGMMAAVYHILFHAFTKPMLFLSGSALSNVSGHSYHLRMLRGSGHRNIPAGIAFSVGAFSMIGIPLFAGFPSKMFLVVSSMTSGILHMPLVFLAIAVSTVLNALYYMPALISIWRRPETNVSVKVPLKEKLFAGTNIWFVSAIVIFIVMNFILGTAFSPISQIINLGLEKI